MIRFAAALACLTVLGTGAAVAGVTKAEYLEPTTRYDHAILGDAVEWGALRLQDERGQSVLIRLPESRVFEDIAPRIIADSSGETYALVVETDIAIGARVALYNTNGLVDATPYLGRTHRWSAPVGAADLDGDGNVEIAFVEKPHLAKELKVWRLKNGKLTFVAGLRGLTNHSIGEDYITSGIRDCGNVKEVITANASWTRVMATKLRNGKLTSREVGPFHGVKSVQDALRCS